MALKKQEDIIEIVKEKLPKYMHDDIINLLDNIPDAEPNVKVVAQISVDTDEIVKRIKEEYNFEPKRKNGHWIEEEKRGIKCSVCNLRFGYLQPKNYCPHCGADMCDGKPEMRPFYRTYS